MIKLIRTVTLALMLPSTASAHVLICERVNEYEIECGPKWVCESTDQGEWLCLNVDTLAQVLYTEGE